MTNGCKDPGIPLERYADIQVVQVELLERIDVLSRDSAEPHLNSAEIQNLQQEYNDMVEQQARFEPNTLRDPMQALPPELWTIIIKYAVEDAYPVDHLLILTSVSQAWCRFLISSPSLWTRIILDPGKKDYLSKAFMGVERSLSCELNLEILVPLDVWHTISALILPHSQRICYLRFSSCDALKILDTFTELPNLTDIRFPHGVALQEQDFTGRKFDRMVSLLTINGAKISKTPSWRKYITHDFVITHDAFSKDSVEQWKMLPNLRRLGILEEANLVSDSSQPSTTLDSLLGSVTQFSYKGGAFQRALRFIGSNLTDLGLSISFDRVFEDLLLTIEPFQCLYRLTIMTSEYPYTTLPHCVKVPSRCIPVRTLHLSLGRDFADPVNHGVVWTATDPFFQALISAMPLVEDFSLQYAVFTEQLCSYIEILHDLRVFSLEGCYIQPGSLAAPLNLKQLDRINWRATPPTLFLHSLSAQVLRTLFVGTDYSSPQRTGDYSGPEEYESYSDPPRDTGDDNPEDYSSGSEDYDDGTGGGYSFALPYHAIPTDAFPNLTSLTFLISSPVSWTLKSLPTLKELGLEPSPHNSLALTWGSDILEVILLRPKEFPALEKIILRGDFLEWDILLLMLERRNIPSRRGMSLVKTLVVDRELPYKLLLPLSMLLQGKFPLITLHFFSIEAIGKRLWKKSSTGCKRCCHTFRACEAVVPTGMNRRPYGFMDAEHEANRMLKWSYRLPSETLDADPPLSPELATWLSGKRERRAKFVSQLSEFAPEFHRQDNCGRMVGPVTITKYCLQGMMFTAKQGTKPSADEVEDSE